MGRSFEQGQTKTFLPGREEHRVGHHVKAVQLAFVDVEVLVDPGYQPLHLQVGSQLFQVGKMFGTRAVVGI